MGQKEKLIKRLKSRPKDFTFDEAETLLKCLNYIRSSQIPPGSLPAGIKAEPVALVLCS